MKNESKQLLEQYGYKEQEYTTVKIETFSDSMNNRMYYSEGEKEWLVPIYTADHVNAVYIDFTMTGITFYDIDNKPLFSTVGEGYSDIVTPLAFCVE